MLPDFETITLNVVPENSARIARRVNGESHILPNLLPDQIELVTDRGQHGETVPGNTSRLVAWPSQMAGRPTSDVDFRQAMAWAIDRQKIVDQVFKGAGRPNSTHLTFGTEYHDLIRLRARAPSGSGVRAAGRPGGEGQGRQSQRERWRVAVVVDDPVAQQHLRQPVPGAHQVSAAVLPSPDQVAGCFLLDARDDHRGDLTHPQQPGQMHASLLSVLTRSPEGLCSFEGAATSQRIPAASRCRYSPNPVGPAS